MLALFSLNLVCLLSFIQFYSFANGQIEICFNLGATKTVNPKEIPQLLQDAKDEIEENFRNSKFGNAGAINYTTFHLNMSHPAVTLEGDLTNGSVIIAEQSLRLFTLRSDGFELFNLTFLNIYINGSYDLKGHIGTPKLFDIYGKGPFFLELKNFSVSLITSLKVNTSSLCVPLTIKVYLKDTEGNFGNLMNGDKDLDPLLNKLLIEIIPDAISVIFREMADWADPYIQKFLDELLNKDKGKSVSKLLNYMVKNPNHQFLKN